MPKVKQAEIPSFVLLLLYFFCQDILVKLLFYTDSVSTKSLKQHFWQSVRLELFFFFYKADKDVGIKHCHYLLPVFLAVQSSLIFSHKAFTRK